MVKIVRISAALLAAVLVIWAAVVLLSREKPPAPPPLTGWMQNFTPAAPARPAPRGAFVARDGRRLSLADFRGRVVLVNFWATWCAPCVREMPSLLRLQKKLGGDDFTVLALSSDAKGWEVVTPFLARLKIEALPVYLDPGMATGQAFRIKGLPTSVLVGRDGREIGRLLGIAEWDSAESVALIGHYIGLGRKGGG